MNEIEQIEADVVTLEAAESVFSRKYGQTYSRYNVELEKMKNQLARLKDKWADAKTIVDRWEHKEKGERIDTVVSYIRHLESELANRPAVYCVRDYNGHIKRMYAGGLSYPILFPSLETARQVVSDGAELYTGAQK